MNSCLFGFAHGNDRRGNEHHFKDIRRNVSPQTGAIDKDDFKFPSDFERMVQSAHELDRQQHQSQAEYGALKQLSEKACNVQVSKPQRPVHQSHVLVSNPAFRSDLNARRTLLWAGMMSVGLPVSLARCRAQHVNALGPTLCVQRPGRLRTASHVLKHSTPSPGSSQEPYFSTHLTTHAMGSMGRVRIECLSSRRVGRKQLYHFPCI